MQLLITFHFLRFSNVYEALCHIRPLNYALEISEINGIWDLMEKYLDIQDIYHG